jgi:hypothetical protein
MADNSDNGFLYFMVGALLIGVFGLGYLYYNGAPSSPRGAGNVNIERTFETAPPNVNIQMDGNRDKGNP